MNEENSSPNPFRYRDYRAFLRDWYFFNKKNRRGFSFRSFSKKAGFNTSNFLLLIMKGKRNLTEESLKKFLVGLEFKSREKEEFFRNLVFFTQAQTHEDKNFYYQRLLQSKRLKSLQPIEKQHYEYYSAWYHPVVRELIIAQGFDGSPEWIAKKIFPPITSAQASKSIELLESLGLIKKQDGHLWCQSSPILSTGPELTSVIVHNYHKHLLDLSKEVMDRISLQERDVSSLTLGVVRKRLPELRAKIRQFRQEILKMISSDTEPEEVVQLNIQFFPVTRILNPIEIKGEKT